MAKKTALVLGASGVVGGGVTRRLIEDGWRVHAAARFSKLAKLDELKRAGVEPIVFDVTKDDAAKLPEAEAVFLEIWDPSRPDLIWPINFYGVGRVVERYCGVADIVNGCTINVYGKCREPATEDTPCRPDGDYGRSRYAQERLIDYFADRGGKRAIHVRYAHSNTATFGIIRRMAKGILEGKSLGRNPDAKLQVIGLEDFVRVTVAALDRADNPPAVVNCCHPRIWTWRELAEAIHSKLGKGEVRFERELGGEENSECADASRMVEWFGEPTISTDELIRRVAADLVRG